MFPLNMSLICSHLSRDACALQICPMLITAQQNLASKLEAASQLAKSRPFAKKREKILKSKLLSWLNSMKERKFHNGNCCRFSVARHAVVLCIISVIFFPKCEFVSKPGSWFASCSLAFVLSGEELHLLCLQLLSLLSTSPINAVEHLHICNLCPGIE